MSTPEERESIGVRVRLVRHPAWWNVEVDGRQVVLVAFHPRQHTDPRPAGALTDKTARRVAVEARKAVKRAIAQLEREATNE